MSSLPNFRVVVSFISFMVFAVCLSQKASALELYDDNELFSKLKKNQVLSDDDIKEVKSSYPKLDLAGSLKLQYMYGQGPDGTKDQSDLFVRRLNLRIVAQLTDLTSFVLEPEYGRDEPLIKDAYLLYKPFGFEVFAGNHRVPFGAETLKNDINLPFAEKNLASQISPEYLPGVSVSKGLFDSKLLIAAGIWNGNLNSAAETNLINNQLADNRIFTSKPGSSGSNIIIEALRIAYSSKEHENFYSGARSFENDENFSGEMSYGAGLSYYNSGSVHDKAPANALTGLNGANAFGIDLAFRIWRVSTEFEYARRSLEWWQYNFAKTSNELVSSTQISYSAQGSVLLIDNLSLGMRYETFVYDDKGTVLKGVSGQNEDKWFTLGLNYYFKEQRTKIQANYVWKSATMPVGVDSPASNTAYLQATMYF